jgi:hypothetical protein
VQGPAVDEDHRLAVGVACRRDVRVEAVEGGRCVLDSLDVELLGQVLQMGAAGFEPATSRV